MGVVRHKNISAIGGVQLAPLTTVGTGYTTNDLLTLVGGNNDCKIRVTLAGDGPSFVILSSVVEVAGTGYEAGVEYSSTGGTGSGAKFTPTSVGYIENLSQDVSDTNPDGYLFRAKIGGSHGSVEVMLDAESENSYTFSAGAGNVSGLFPDTTVSTIRFSPSEDFDGTIDNVSLKKVLGASYGPELADNGKFNFGTDSWTLGAGWQYFGSTGDSGQLPVYSSSLPSAIARVRQGLSFPTFVVGGNQDGGESPVSALFKKSESYGLHLFRSGVFHVGFPFKVIEIDIPLATSLGPDCSMLPVLHFDNDNFQSAGTEVNDTNYNDDNVNFIAAKSDSFEGGVKGSNDFYLELQITGPELLTISLPITIIIENERTGQQSSFSISSIFNGIMPSNKFGGEGQYLYGLGIDPDVPASDDPEDLRTAGMIRPVSYEQFSAEGVDGPAIAIIPNPKDNRIYVVLATGRVLSYDKDLGDETLVGHVQESSMDVPARGAWYQNNYIYIVTPHDVSRLGPMDGSPVIVDEVWTGATLGSQDPLVDSEYPISLFEIGYLNHHGIVHTDGAGYFLDFSEGIGLVHKINTEKGTAQGDTDNSVLPSAYGIIDLPPDFIPMTISSYGNNIAVGGNYTTDSEVFQGKSALLFFNPADSIPSFYSIVPLPDAICSGLLYDNSQLYGFCGDLAGGYRLFRYVGGDAIQTLKITEDGVPPLQTGIASAGNRVVWGTYTTSPITTSGLLAYGSKSDLFPNGLHHIAVLKDYEQVD